MDMACSTNRHLTPWLKISRNVRTSNPLLCLHAILQGDHYRFTQYISPNIVRIDEEKDEMGYTEREEDEKIVWKLRQTNR